jgi:hypothetical protein
MSPIDEVTEPNSPTSLPDSLRDSHASKYYWETDAVTGYYEFTNYSRILAATESNAEHQKSVANIPSGRPSTRLDNPKDYLIDLDGKRSSQHSGKSDASKSRPTSTVSAGTVFEECSGKTDASKSRPPSAVSVRTVFEEDEDKPSCLRSGERESRRRRR